MEERDSFTVHKPSLCLSLALDVIHRFGVLKINNPKFDEQNFSITENESCHCAGNVKIVLS